MKQKDNILKALRKQGYEAMYVKGVYVFKSGLRLSTEKARQLSGIAVTSKPRKQKQLPYGDYAWVAALNRIKLL